MKPNKVKLSMTFESSTEERLIRYQKSNKLPSKSYTANLLLDEILTEKENPLKQTLNYINGKK